MLRSKSSTHRLCHRWTWRHVVFAQALVHGRDAHARCLSKLDDQTVWSPTHTNDKNKKQAYSYLVFSNLLPGQLALELFQIWNFLIVPNNTQGHIFFVLRTKKRPQHFFACLSAADSRVRKTELDSEFSKVFATKPTEPSASCLSPDGLASSSCPTR